MAVPADNSAIAMRRATYASVAVALLLILLKAGAWLMTDSVSLLTTLVDSLTDFGASVLNLIAVRQALQPPNQQYRFGYGKAEPLAGLGQAAFVAGSAMFLIVESVRRLITPHPVGHEGVGVAVMLIAMALTFALVRYQRRVIARTGSLAIGADALHYQGDFLVHGGVILALLANMWLDVPWLDPLFALGVAGYILFTARGIAIGSLGALMDRELPEADRERIAAIALAHPEVLNIHDLRTRTSGMQAFIQFHLTLPDDLSLLRAHEIAEAIEAEVGAAFPGAGVIVHEDPESVAGLGAQGVRRREQA